MPANSVQRHSYFEPNRLREWVANVVAPPRDFDSEPEGLFMPTSLLPASDRQDMRSPRLSSSRAPLIGRGLRQRSNTIRSILGFSVPQSDFHKMLIAAPILGQGSYHRVVRPNLGFYLHHAEEGHTVDDIVVSLSSSSGRSDDGSFQAIRLADKKIAAYLMQDVDGTHHTEHLRTIVSRTVSPGSFYSVDKYAGVDLYQAGMRENLFLPEHVFQLASAIVALHDQGLVHRDIKPDNVMLSPKTDNGFVQLGDFGFLTAFDEEKQKDAVMQLSQDQDFQSLCDHNNLDAGAQISRALTHLSVSHACGTKEYISPKAARGEPYRKSDDIYSFAATLLAVTTQEEPEFFSTDGKYPSRFDPNRGVKLSQGYHEGRKHQFGLWHILAANGQVLTEAFTAVLQEMILNVEKPVDERIEDIGYFVDKLQSALSEHGLYRPNKGGLFGCIPCLA